VSSKMIMGFWGPNHKSARLYSFLSKLWRISVGLGSVPREIKTRRPEAQLNWLDLRSLSLEKALVPL
jgi:hypothetical protein